MELAKKKRIRDWLSALPENNRQPTIPLTGVKDLIDYGKKCDAVTLLKNPNLQLQEGIDWIQIETPTGGYEYLLTPHAAQQWLQASRKPLSYTVRQIFIEEEEILQGLRKQVLSGEVMIANIESGEVVFNPVPSAPMASSDPCPPPPEDRPPAPPASSPCPPPPEERPLVPAASSPLPPPAPAADPVVDDMEPVPLDDSSESEDDDVNEQPALVNEPQSICEIRKALRGCDSSLKPVLVAMMNRRAKQEIQNHHDISRIRAETEAKVKNLQAETEAKVKILQAEADADHEGRAKLVEAEVIKLKAETIAKIKTIQAPY